MKTCLKCGKEFKIKIKINGKIKNLGNRKYCIECSPFGVHNTKQFHLSDSEKNERRKLWKREKRQYIPDEMRERIISLYKDGFSYKDILSKIDTSSATICKVISESGIKRSISEANKLAKLQGKGQLTDEGRRRLSENGKKAVMSGNKIWTKPEKVFKTILNEENIGVKFPEIVKGCLSLNDDENAVVIFQYPLQRYLCDFYDTEYNVVYQINGDYWHANPLLYDHNNLTKVQKNNVHHDKNRKIYIEGKGIKIIDIWESEIYWNKDLVKEKIREVRKQGNPSVLHTELAGIVTQTSHHNDEEWNKKVKDMWFKKDKKVNSLGTRDENGKFIKRETKIYKLICKNQICKKEFETAVKKQKYCCLECKGIYQRRAIRPSKEELEREVSSMPMTHIGKKYGVSDNAIKKWCKSYGIVLENRRGYWQKVEANNNL